MRRRDKQTCSDGLFPCPCFLVISPLFDTLFTHITLSHYLHIPLRSHPHHSLLSTLISHFIPFSSPLFTSLLSPLIFPLPPLISHLYPLLSSPFCLISPLSSPISLYLSHLSPLSFLIHRFQAEHNNELIAYIEKEANWRFPPGFAKDMPSARLTIDPVFATQR